MDAGDEVAVALTAETLAAAGVPDVERVLAAAAPLASWIATAPATPLLDGLRVAADPAAALHAIETLVGAAPGPIDRLDLLLRVLGGSPSLVTALTREGAGWPALVARMQVESIRTASEHVGTLEQAGAVGPLARPALQALLRRHRRREIFRIGGRDVGGLATVDDTVRELSELAEGLIEVATRCVRARIAADWGADTPVPFVVLGMGKLGGEELNYSSDVDLVYVHGEEVDHPSGRPVRLFFAKMAEEVTKAIADVTEDGLCFRVDVRLRPGGDQSPLAVSMAGTLAYYEAWGQTWERSVWLKARPVGGDRALGAALLDELAPFVYRRFLDFATLEDLNAMKRRVDQSLRRGQYERDVKLGRGGIREIEFWVQAHQLVNAGKDARLQVRGTLTSLERLAAFGYVEPALAARLAAAYRFLRDVEHKIQIARERQSQRIPDEPEEHAVFVRRLGYLGTDGAAAFEAARAAETDFVHATFEALFHGAEETRRREERPDVAQLMDELHDVAVTRTRLRVLGFRDLDAAAADLRLLRDGPSHAPAHAHRARAMAALAPALVSELARVADPDRALHHLASFIASIGARTSFLHLLLENPGVMRLLVRLFGTSEFLSRDFLRHPELLDSLVRADLVRLVRTPEDQAGELAGRLAAAPDLETRLDVIRRFRHEEFLRIGVHDIEGELAGDVVREQLSTLAEVALAAAVGIATDAMRARLGLPDGGPTDGLAVVGLGKLGGRELNYHSDLDIVFIYDAGPEAWWSTHGIGPHEYFSRVAQRTISALQTPTREGVAYKIDTRLRPSGNKGTLVSSLAAFEAYHAESAALWERQALAKARLLTGPPALRSRAAAVIERIVYGRPLTASDVAEMAAMRARIANERGAPGDAVNIKTDWGGLVDVEFAVQMLQIRHGHADPRVRLQATRAALDALIAVGALPPADGERLRDGYAFLRDLEGRLRIERDQPVEAIDADPAAMLGPARRLGYTGTDDEAVARFAAEFGRHRAAIREVYARLFATAERHA
jgi:glutamate-ammonia-ligase adenylyltransferase